MALPYPMSPVSPFDVITSQAENEKIANIESLADGTGIDDGAITASKIDFPTLNFGNYSTSEVDTGFTWVDGKAIYKKTIDFGSIPDTTKKNVAHNVTGIDRVINYEALLKDPINNFLTLPFVRASGGTDNIELRVSPTDITVTANSRNFINFSAYITIYYTKV